jgi:hypothetical protein
MQLTRFTSLLSLSFVLTLLLQNHASAQDATGPLAQESSSYEDGMGAVDVSQEAPAPVEAAPRARQPVVGRQAAQKYMAPKRQSAAATAEGGHEFNHYFSVGVGSSVSDKAYHWGGGDTISDVEKFNINVTYRFGEWVNVADLSLRTEYTSYSIRGVNARKISLVPLVTFPDVSSRFPLYFGLGIGPGFFINQYPGDSFFAIDYTILAGLRFLNVFDNLGFFAEGGLKNHFLVFSEGQFNGYFITLGTVFAF